ncbi:hypothetical protein T492DRAFT_874992 [Pavlovales sp. CCMP2436]|nr:hypothetical protein T492DRAFT_874992 [Pavlovales sp. CCMP2436]
MPGIWCKRFGCRASKGAGGRGAAPRAAEHCASCSTTAEKYKKDTGAYKPEDAAPMAYRVRRLEEHAKARPRDRGPEYEAYNEKWRSLHWTTGVIVLADTDVVFLSDFSHFSDMALLEAFSGYGFGHPWSVRKWGATILALMLSGRLGSGLAASGSAVAGSVAGLTEVKS